MIFFEITSISLCLQFVTCYYNYRLQGTLQPTTNISFFLVQNYFVDVVVWLHGPVSITTFVSVAIFKHFTLTLLHSLPI